MAYTARQAANATGVATSTITKAIKTGKISAQRDEQGSWSIEPAELHRVYPPKAENPLSKASIEQDAKPGNGVENRGLERLVETLQEQLRDLREDRDGWRGQAETWQHEADTWRRQAENLLMRLPAPAAPQAGPVTVPDAPASGQGKPVGRFWSRLWGKAASND